MPSNTSLIWTDESSGIQIAYGDLPNVLVFSAPSGVVVHVDVATRQETLIKSRGVSDAEIAHVLENFVRPRIAAKDGALVLHGSTALCQDQALVFVGPTGRGKSTLMSSFWTARGGRIGDDSLMCHLDGPRPCVSPLNNSFRLNPDSVDALSIAGADETVSELRLKRRVAIAADDLVAAPIPVAALFSLAPPAETDDIRMTALPSGAACMDVIRNSFALDPVAPAPARARMEAASRFVAGVPCFTLSYPRDYQRLPEVHQAVLNAAFAADLPTRDATSISNPPETSDQDG